MHFEPTVKQLYHSGHAERKTVEKRQNITMEIIKFIFTDRRPKKKTIETLEAFMSRVYTIPPNIYLYYFFFLIRLELYKLLGMPCKKKRYDILCLS